MCDDVSILKLVLAELCQKRLLIVTGKGGVGKSTVAGALALASTQSGAKTLLCEVNADSRLPELLGVAEPGPEVAEAEHNLWTLNVRPRESMLEYVKMRLGFERLSRAMLESSMMRAFLRFVPSLQELVLLGKILYLVRERTAGGAYRFDRIILDAPATGHLVPFLSVPTVIREALPAGVLATEVTWMREELADRERTGVVLVATPEETSLSEVLELGPNLNDRVGVHPIAVALNRATLPRFSAEDVDALPALLKPAAERHRRAAEATLAAERALAPLGLPLTLVPELFYERFQREALHAVAQRFVGAT